MAVCGPVATGINVSNPAFPHPRAGRPMYNCPTLILQALNISLLSPHLQQNCPIDDDDEYYSLWGGRGAS
jgi:hypothetical protein